MITRENVTDLLKRYALPGVLILVLVLILPMMTFLSRESLFGGREQVVKQEYRELFGGTLAYRSSELFSLGIGTEPSGIGLQPTDFGTSIAYEVVTPGPNGDIWLVDHPDVGIPGARVRRFSSSGARLAEFRTPAGTTLFTPGIAGDLWVDQSGGEKSNEALLHYSGEGKLLASYTLPERLYARTLQISPLGRVYVGIEQYWTDPESGSSSFAGELVPVVEPDGKRVVDTKAGTVPETFIGADGNFYGLTGEIPKDQAYGHPTFTVHVRNKDGKDVRQFKLPHGLRPYHADAQGRVYAQEMPPIEDSYGQAALGDLGAENTLIHVFDTKGKLIARVPVQRSLSVGGWAPDATVDKDGRLYSTRYTDTDFQLIVSEPAGISGLDEADDKPGAPSARVIVTDEAPISPDPYLSTDSVQRDVWRMVYSGLVSHDASLNAIPDLAEFVPTVGNGVSPDGRTITWKLRKDREWHDGQKVTANDVVATWRHLKSTAPSSYGVPFPGFNLIESVTAGDGEVTVKLSEPFGAAPECFFPFVLSERLVEAGEDGLDIVAYSAPVGSGPYEVLRFETDRLMLGRSNELGVGSIARIDVEFLDAADSVQLYQTADVPMIWAWVPVFESDTVERDAIGATIEVPTGRWAGTVMNTRSELLGDASVRRGLLSAIPVGEIRSLYGDTDTTMTAMFTRTPSGALGPVATVSTATIEVSKSEVRSLAAIQKAQPTKKRIAYSENVRGGINEILAEDMRLIESAWTALGIENYPRFGRPRFYANYAMLGFLSQGNTDAGAGVFPAFPDPGWGSLCDPSDIPGVTNVYGANITGTTDPLLRKLHAQARASYDPKERAKLGVRIQQRASELGLLLPQRSERRSVAVMGISGYDPGPYSAGDFWNVADWRLE